MSAEIYDAIEYAMQVGFLMGFLVGGITLLMVGALLRPIEGKESHDRR